jgi:cytochrome c peroxidase
MYQKIGLVKPYPTSDVGRVTVTKDEADRYVFKVPSLRNVAKTAPYFHDGQVATLDQAIRLMGEHQLGRTLTDRQVAGIGAFLGSLTGEIPKDYVAPPALPPSGPKTPKPDPT